MHLSYIVHLVILFAKNQRYNDSKVVTAEESDFYHASLTCATRRFSTVPQTAACICSVLKDSFMASECPPHALA